MRPSHTVSETTITGIDPAAIRAVRIPRQATRLRHDAFWPIFTGRPSVFLTLTTTKPSTTAMKALRPSHICFRLSDEHCPNELYRQEKAFEVEGHKRK